MTTTAKAIKHSWIPRGRGKGGEFSNCTPYDSDADTLVSVNNCAIDSNSWVLRPAETSPNNLVTAGAGTAQWLSPVDANGVVYTYNSIAMGNFYLGGTALYTSVYGSIAGSSVLGGVMLVDPYNATKHTLRATTNNAKWIFKMVKNRMYMANGIDRPMISSDPRAASAGSWPNAGIGFTSTNIYPWGVTAPVTAPTYSITTGAITAGNIDVTNGSPNLTGHGTSFTSAAVGQTIFLLGIPYQIGSITSNTVASIIGGPNGDGTYAGATGNVPNGGWQINTGNLSWAPGAGYIYAYAYYDPTTGHVSNMSPLTYVNDGPPNNVGVSVVLNNIAQLKDANNVNPDPRFTKIVIYRTAQGGGVLFPLAVISNSAASPPYTYTDTQSDDTKLGTVGPGFFPGPFTTNQPPPNDINFVSYWNGRFWGFSQSNPGLLFFSARVDSSNSEIPVGVAEECWPLSNTIPIPDTDGVGTGLRVVGPNLMVLTTRGIYTVGGSNPASYQLARITTKGNGTYHFATCALPGEDANSADALVHCGNDSRVYFLYGAGGDVAYSYPIQDQLIPNPNTTQASVDFTVEMFHNKQGTYLFVVDQTGFTHVYDVERQVWFKWTLGFGPGGGGGNYAMTEGLLWGNNVFLIANTAGIWGLVTDPDPSIAIYTSTIVTQRFAPPGIDRFETKMLSELDLYDVAGNTSWGVIAQADARPTVSLVANTDTTTRSILSEPSELYFPRNTTPTLTQGRTFTFTFQVNNNTRAKFKLAKIEAIWVAVSEDDGTPPK